jgi:hypothetical protein
LLCPLDHHVVVLATLGFASGVPDAMYSVPAGRLAEHEGAGQIVAGARLASMESPRSRR